MTPHPSAPVLCADLLALIVLMTGLSIRATVYTLSPQGSSSITGEQALHGIRTQRAHAQDLSDRQPLNETYGRLLLTNTLIVNSTGDGADSDTGDGTCNDGANHCTLRAAIQQANFTTGANVIAFNIPGINPRIVAVTSPLPEITDPLTIDGTTQPGFAGTPVVGLSGAGVNGAHGLRITAGSSRVRGLVISNFSGHGIVLQGGSGNLVDGNFIGTGATGDAAEGNGGAGVYVDHSPNALIGGAASGARNVISGNGRFGVYILNGSGGAQVINNYFGTNAAGTTSLPNGVHGILLESSTDATITGNVVASSGASGIVLVDAADTTIQANRIGLDAAGTAAMGNGGDDIYVYASPNVMIGGTFPAARNIIANGGHFGVYVLAGSPGAKVQGNYIGTDISGTVMMPHGSHGVVLENSGAGLVTDNVVVDSTDSGIVLVNAADSIIESNLVGVDALRASLSLPRSGSRF